MMYLELLVDMWHAGGFIPNDDEYLAALWRVRRRGKQFTVNCQLIRSYLTVTCDLLSHPRLLDEVEKHHEISEVRSKTGRLGGLKTQANAKAEEKSIGNRVEPPLDPPSKPQQIVHGKEKNNGASRRRAAGKGPKTRKGTRLPEDWFPSTSDRAYARSTGISEGDIDSVALDFHAYWTNGNGKNKAHVSWSQTWQGWCRRQIRDFSKRGAAHRERAGGVAAAAGELLDPGDR